MSSKNATAEALCQVGGRAKALTYAQPVVSASLRLAAAIGATSSQREVAKRLGVSSAAVAQWCNGASSKLPSGRKRAELALRCPEVAAELLRLETEALKRNKTAAPVDPTIGLMQTQRELGEYAGALCEAMADGKLTREELRRLMKELRDVRNAADRALMQLEARFMEATP